MTKAHDRQTQYWLKFVRDNRGDLTQIRSHYDKIEQAWETADEQHQLEFLVGLESYFAGNNLWLDYRTKLQLAIPIAQQMNNGQLEAYCLNNLAYCYTQLGEHQRALDVYQQALERQRRNGNITAEISLWIDMGATYEILEQQDQALTYYREGLKLARTHNEFNQQISALSQMAHLLQRIGWRDEEEVQLYEEMLQIYRQTGNVAGEIVTLVSLSGLYGNHMINNPAKARECIAQAKRLPPPAELSPEFIAALARS